MTTARYDPIKVKHETGPVVELEGVPTIPDIAAAEFLRGDGDLTPAAEAAANKRIELAMQILRERKQTAFEKSSKGSTKYWIDAESDDDDFSNPKERRKSNGKTATAILGTHKRRRATARRRRLAVQQTTRPGRR